MKIAREIVRTMIYHRLLTEPAFANENIEINDAVDVIERHLKPVIEALQAGIKCALLVDHEAAEHLIRQTISLFEEA